MTMKQIELRRRVRRLVWLYLSLSFAFSMGHAFFFSTYSLYLMSKGLDLLQINVVNCVFMVSVFLLEIPTGAYADLFGRKRSFVAGCFVLGLSMATYWIADSFWMCIVAELLAALGTALHSGSMEAWIVDSMRLTGFRGSLHTLFCRERYACEAGIVAGAFTGGYLAGYDLALPWIVAAVAIWLVGLWAAHAMQETPLAPRRPVSGFESMRQVARDSIDYGVRHKGILYVVLFGSVVSMCCQGMNMQWQVRLANDCSFDTQHLGWVFVGVSGCLMLGGRLSSLFASRYGTGRRAIVMSQCVTAVGIIGAGLFSSVVPMLGAFFVHEIGRGAMGPLKRAYTNARIPSSTRATILSFDSMILHVGAFFGLLSSGFVANYWSISVAWIWSGLLLAIAIPMFLLLKNGDGGARQ